MTEPTPTKRVLLARRPLTKEQQALECPGADTVVGIGILIERHLDYAGRLATILRRRAGRVAWRGVMDRDDCAQAAYLGLCQAAAAYDPAQDRDFRTFAYPRIAGAIVDELRRTMPLGYRQSRDRAPSRVEWALDRVAATARPEIARVESDDEVETRLGRLGPTRSRIVRAHAIEGQSMARVARDLACDRATATRQYRAAIRQLALAYAAAS